MKKFIILILISLLTNTYSQINIIPKPQEIKILDGTFLLNAQTTIVYSEQTESIAYYLKEYLKSSFGMELKASQEQNKNSIRLILKDVENIYNNPEGYHLSVTKDNILVEANSKQGLFYAIQTMKQIITDNFNKNGVEVPSLDIYDYPKFKWRGLNLDCCRHFMSKDFIKRYIDLLALQKMNILHWHLTEDQGWRIEIKKYPELTEIGAFRKYDDGSVYGGFYTQDDIKEIVMYASERFITVVPEIEMPGHSTAAIATYPNLSCTGGPFEVGTLWGIYKDIYCAGNEDTFKFIEDVLSEVIELFPSKYIHIGGDEAPKDRWKNCPKCQLRIKEENLADEHELQSYFIKRVEKFLNSKGKEIIGWDEILEGGLAPGATVQSWRGTKGAIDAAKMNHDVIVSPTSHCYFDYPIETTDVPKVYSFNPIPVELTDQEAKHVLGSEVNMWTEYAPQQVIDYRLFPRLTAMAEVLWTYPSERNYQDFSNRLQSFYNILDEIRVNYNFEIPPVSFTEYFDSNLNQFFVTAEVKQKGLELFYSTDNTEPTIHSLKYENKIELDKSVNLKIAFYRGKKKVGETIEREYSISRSNNKKLTLTYPASDRFEKGNISVLTDGIRGGNNYRIGGYLGFQSTDFEAVIDLDNEIDLSKISVGFFTASSSLVLLPEFAEFFISDDGENYESIGKLIKNFSLKDPSWKRIDYDIILSNTKARYIKIFAKNPMQVPQWHPAFGGKVWLMVDEIIVE